MTTYGSLFSGYGGLDLAVEEVFGAACVWHAETDTDASNALAHHWPGVPNLGDVEAVDWSTVEPVDVICGGSPCQDLSSAGARKGMGPGTRSGLWSAMCRAIEAVQPRAVVWENVSGAVSACAHSDLQPCPGCVGDEPHDPVLRALGRVLGDLASLGFDAEWVMLPASAVGACHRRERVFVVAWPADSDLSGLEGPEPTARRLVPAGSGSGPLSLLPSPRTSDTNGSGERNGHARNLAAEVKPSEAALAGGPGEANGGTQAWGRYEAAIRRHEAALGRLAPPPTDENGRLSARFCEWMMMLPEGWVTDHMGRAAALRALGNGVVPPQAVAAIRTAIGRAEAA